MGYIGKIKLPDNKTYDIKHTIIPVVGTQTAATGSWTGTIDVDSLYDGLTIAYFLPYAGSGNATLNLTLKDGTTTGAINCYYNSARLTTHYGKGSNIIMTYWSAGSIKIDGSATPEDRWIAQADYNTNTDTKTQQTINNNNKYYPLLFSYAEENNTTTNITNISYRNNDFFINPSAGYIYSKKGFCAGPFTTATAGKRVWVSQDGIYANNFLDDYSVSAYERMIVRVWPGKHTSANGLLLTVDSGGLTMIGGGESSTNLAGLIDNDQTTDSPKRLDINNSQDATGKETTAFTADSEHLVLSSDGSIYFVTGCQTLANRAAVCLNNARTFYPMTNNSGKIGSSSYRWQYGYFGQIYGTGSSGMWKSARDNASFIKDTDFNDENNYAPIIDLKTTNGDWSIGALRDAEYLIFSYVMDSTYSGSDNKARKYVLEAPSTPDSNIYHILHSGNLKTYTIPNVTSVGTLPSLVTKDTSFYPVKSTTTTASKIVSKDITIYPVTSSTTTATKVTLGTSISADDITSWDEGTLPSFTVSKGVLTLDSGTSPSLSYTSRSIPNVTGNTNVAVPVLSSSVTIKEISTNTDVAVPILSSAVTISGVSTWSAGTLPSLDTAISVVGLSST